MLRAKAYNDRLTILRAVQHAGGGVDQRGGERWRCDGEVCVLQGVVELDDVDTSIARLPNGSDENRLARQARHANEIAQLGFDPPGQLHQGVAWGVGE